MQVNFQFVVFEKLTWVSEVSSNYTHNIHRSPMPEKRGGQKRKYQVKDWVKATDYKSLSMPRYQSL